jgi:hypothetical protein
MRSGGGGHGDADEEGAVGAGLNGVRDVFLQDDYAACTDVGCCVIGGDAGAAAEGVNADDAFDLVRRHGGAGAECDEGDAQMAFLHKGLRGAAVLRRGGAFLEGCVFLLE